MYKLIGDRELTAQHIRTHITQTQTNNDDDNNKSGHYNVISNIKMNALPFPGLAFSLSLFSFHFLSPLPPPPPHYTSSNILHFVYAHRANILFALYALLWTWDEQFTCYCFAIDASRQMNTDAMRISQTYAEKANRMRKLPSEMREETRAYIVKG